MTPLKIILFLLLYPFLYLNAGTPDNGDWENNWPQWRGPAATGVAPLGDPPVHWGEEKNIKWKKEPPGRGSGSPVVWENHIFLLTAIDTGRKPDTPPKFPEPPEPPRTRAPDTLHRFEVLCIDRKTGKTAWQRTAIETVPHAGHHRDHGYASASPITDGRFVYASFGSQGIYCYDVEGELKWRRDLGDMFTRRGWGEGVSPALHGGLLAVNWDHEGESFIEILDAGTGKTKWKASLDEVTSWATPIMVEQGGTTQLIVNATRRVTSYDLATGKILWECGGQTVNAIPCPVAGKDRVFCMSGYRGNALFAIPLDAEGDLTDSDRILWRHDRGTPYVPSPILYGKHLYFTHGNGGNLSCLNAANGKPLFEGVRLPHIKGLYASPVGAADRIYFLGRNGTALVIRKHSGLEVLATNRLEDGFDASPAIKGKDLILRGRKYLYCIAEPSE
jgi:outer membrane protein assembly factor BamB